MQQSASPYVLWFPYSEETNYNYEHLPQRYLQLKRLNKRKDCVVTLLRTEFKAKTENAERERTVIFGNIHVR